MNGLRAREQCLLGANDHVESNEINIRCLILTVICWHDDVGFYIPRGRKTSNLLIPFMKLKIFWRRLLISSVCQAARAGRMLLG